MATASLADRTAPTANGAIRRSTLVLRHWFVVIVGAMILATGSAVGRGGLRFALRAWPPTSEASGLIGIAFALIVVPPIVVALLATLSGRQLWQRFVLFLPAFAMQVGVYVAFWCYGGSAERAVAFLWMCPLLVVAAALPAFLARLWRGWILTPAGGDGRPRSSSIASLLWMTTLWAVAAACTQRVNTHHWFSSEDQHERPTELLALTFSLSLPALFVGAAMVLALRAVMIQRIYVAFLSATALAALFVAIATGGVVLLASSANDELTTTGLFDTAIGVSCFCLTALTIGLASFVLLRAIGCRFLHGRSLIESA
jgi:hypothetical protein